MIKLATPTSSGSTTHYVAPDGICQVTEACVSSQWHGIRSIVKLLAVEADIEVKSIKHRYGRLVRIGQDHEDSIDGLDTTFRVIDEPRRSYYAVTECEPLLTG